MQVISAEALDHELATFVDPEGRSMYARVEETPGQLIAYPRGIPIWFVIACMATPGISFVGMIVYKLDEIKRSEVLLTFIIIMAAMFPVVCIFFVALFTWGNRQATDQRAFFVLDKGQRTLTLSRCGLVLMEKQIHAFVEVHGWYVTQNKRGSLSEWIGELTVLVNTEIGELNRYPVITCFHTSKVTKLALQLSETFGKERRLLRLTRKMHRRLADGPPRTI